MDKEISHSKTTTNEEDVICVGDVVRTGRLADSFQVSLFKQELAGYIGQKAGVATNSGTNALHLALLALDKNEKDGRDEIIIPSFCCTALLNVIYAARLKPRISDINENDYNISLDEIYKNLNKRTKAIIAPHMFGDPIKNIEDIVRLDVEVIEDCALSVGASINGKKLGSFSSLSVFSFAATKMMATGQGGMVLTSSEKFLERLEKLTGYDNQEEFYPSFNFKLADILAALGRNQLKRLDDFIDKRREIAKKYNENFQNLGKLRVPKRSKESVYFRYILHVENADEFIKNIKKENINCEKPVFKPLHCYFGMDKRNFPNTEKAYKECVSVPIYPLITENEINYVIEKIRARG